MAALAQPKVWPIGSAKAGYVFKIRTTYMKLIIYFSTKF